MPQEQKIPRDYITTKSGQAIYLSYPAKNGQLIRYHLLFHRQDHECSWFPIPEKDVCLILVRQANERYEPGEFCQMLATPCMGDSIPFILTTDENRQPVMCMIKVGMTDNQFTVCIDSEHHVQLLSQEMLPRTLINVN